MRLVDSNEAGAQQSCEWPTCVMSDPAASRVSFEDLDPLQQPSQPKANRDNMLRGSVSTGGLRAKAFGRASSIGTNLLGKASALSSQHEQFSAVTQGLNRAQGFLSSHQQTRSPYDNISASSSTASASRLRLLTSSGRAARKSSNYTEERCVSFPSYAVVRPTLGVPQVEVEVSGFVFRTRPIDQATRTQKVFVKLAQQLAGVKKPSSKPNSPKPSPRNSVVFEESQSRKSTSGSSTPTSSEASYDPSSQDRMLADILALTDQQATDADVRKAFADLKLTDEPQSLYTPESTPPQTPRVSTTDFSMTNISEETSPTTPKKVPSNKKAPPPIPPKPSPRKSSSTATTSSYSSTYSSSVPSDAGSSTTSLSSRHPHHEAVGSTFSNLDLDTDAKQMYQNLQDRLRAFFSQKLDQRRVRLSIFLDDPDIPEAEQRCLARGTIVSAPGGGFKQIVSFPAILKDTEQHLLHSWLRITTELLPMDEDATESNAPGRFDSSSAKVLPHNIPRVISDIDDTVKISEVLGGARRVFRNVFALPFDRITVHGMSDWYNQMTARGAAIHYVSNGPWELTEVVRRFLESAGLPHGQLRLKEYVGGSFFSGMWESAATRKRQNVVSVLSNFPDSKFILIGDSGEQDLELYTEVARSFPGRILGIKPPGGRQLADATTDALSPNNPLHTTDYGELRISISLYRRLREAEAILPDGCILRSFKSGTEVAEDAIMLVEAAMQELQKTRPPLPPRNSTVTPDQKRKPPPPLPARPSHLGKA